MRVAVTASGTTLDATIDPRFGRAKYFLVVDTDSLDSQAVDNVQNLQAAQGAGIQAARTVAALNVQAVLTGHVGPKAFAALQAAGIKTCTGACGTVREALQTFLAGNLPPIEAADVEGHWI